MQTVSLKCSNCGGNLQIRQNITNLACGYCGVSLMVEREGGATYLHQIAAGIADILRGTDKTAAELALQRLICNPSVPPCLSSKF